MLHCDIFSSFFLPSRSPNGHSAKGPKKTKSSLLSPKQRRPAVGKPGARRGGQKEENGQSGDPSEGGEEAGGG